MDKNSSNNCIECTVTQCANHSCNSNHCALERIKIGTHEKNPTVVQCVDCESFVLANPNCGCNK